MVNRVTKPKMSVSQLVSDMKDIRGITFNYMDETIAIDYLSNINNYLRTAAYRKNYQKYQKGPKKGKYLNLDFSYLVEMSVLDMHYRFLVQKMCSDIEHSMCVQLIRDIENDSTTDGYDLVHSFLTKYPKEIKKIQSTIASPHTGNLLWKYFTINIRPNGHHHITNYDDCPVWVLMELLSFGSIINFYLDYYDSRGISHIPKEVLNLVRSLRNAAAHNNCILSDLNSKTTVSTQVIIDFVKNIEGITKSSRRKKLSSRAVLEFVALIYVYDKFVTGKVRKHRLQELNLFINKRMIEKSGFFRENDLISSTYKFIHHIVTFLILSK